jgi:hypothetical protein
MDKHAFAELVATSNTDLAAVLIFFDFTLPRENPAMVSEIFKWSDLQKGKKDRNPPRRVIWKFDSDPDRKSFAITQAFQGEDSHDRFDNFLASLPIEEERLGTLKALHSASVAQAGREILNIRKELLDLIKQAPDQALWQVIVYDSGKIKSLFPKAASDEVKAKFMEKE